MREKKPCAKLENWAVVPSAHCASYHELRAGNLLVGRVFGHPKIQDGAFIFTSPILTLDVETKVAETSNTAYCLGKASSEYTKWRECKRAAA